MASQALLLFQCQTEQAVGQMQFFEREEHIAQTIERCHTVLSGREGRLVSIFLTEFQSLIVVLGSIFVHSHPPVIGSQMIISPDDFHRILSFNSTIQPFPMRSQGIGKLAIVTVTTSQLLIDKSES